MGYRPPNREKVGPKEEEIKQSLRFEKRKCGHTLDETSHYATVPNSDRDNAQGVRTHLKTQMRTELKCPVWGEGKADCPKLYFGQSA